MAKAFTKFKEDGSLLVVYFSGKSMERVLNEDFWSNSFWKPYAAGDARFVCYVTDVDEVIGNVTLCSPFNNSFSSPGTSGTISFSLIGEVLDVGVFPKGPVKLHKEMVSWHGVSKGMKLCRIFQEA